MPIMMMRHLTGTGGTSGAFQRSRVGAVMNVAASLGSCRSTLKLAEAYDWIYGAMGVHPVRQGSWTRRPTVD